MAIGTVQFVGLGQPAFKQTANFRDRNLCQRTRHISAASGLEEEAATAASAATTVKEAANTSFLKRLGHAWDVLFPPAPTSQSCVSNAEIAKQRLKMILFSDRCSINDEARKKIVGNIVGALADFVEIESEDKVQLNVLVDPDLGTVYSVTVPVRRVKPEYQDCNDLESSITYPDPPGLSTLQLE